MPKQTVKKTPTAKLKADLMKMSAIVGRMADSVIITDAAGVIEYVNPAFESLTGYSAQEVIGKNPSIISSGQHDREFYQELWGTLLRGEVFRGEFINRKKDGSLYYEVKTITPILNEDGKIQNFLSTGRDVTEDKQTEAILIESEQRFRSLFEAGTSIMLVIDAKSGLIVDANQAASDFYGYSVDALRTMNIDQINTLSAEEVAAKRGEALKKKLNFFIFQHRLANGEIRTVEVRSHPIRGVDQDLLYTIINDVTEREEARQLAEIREQQLRILYEFSQRVNSTLDPQEIYQTVLEFLALITEVHSLIISRFDKDSKLITCRAFWIDDHWLDVSEFPPIPLEEEGRGTQSVVIRSGQSMLVGDYQARIRTANSNTYVNGETDEIVETPPPDAEVARSAMIVPLKVQGQVHGVVQVMSGKLNAYTESHLKLFESLSLHIASAEKNAMYVAMVRQELAERTRAEESMRILNRTYAVMSGVNKTILRVRDTQKLFDEACEIAVEMGGFRMVWIGLLDEETLEIRPVASAGHVGDYLDQLKISLADNQRGRGPTGNALRSGKHAVINDVAIDPRVTPWREAALRMGYRSSAAFPLFVHGAVRGTMNLYSQDTGFFNEDEVKHLKDMAADISFAMEYLEQQKDRERTAEALRRRNEEYSLISDNTVDVIWVLDLEAQRFTYVSPSIMKLRGLTVEEAMAESIQDALLPASLEKLMAAMPRRFQDYQLKGDTASFIDLVEQRHKNGTIIQVEITSTFVTTPSGRVQVVGLSRDVSERRHLEILQETVYGIANAAQNTETLEELYPRIYDLINQVMPAHNLYLALYDDAAGTLRYVYSVDEMEDADPKPFIPGKGMTAYVLRTSQSLLCTSDEMEKLIRAGEVELIGTQCAVWLGVPLITRGRTVGVMAVQHYQDPAAFGKREQNILEFVSAQIATAIERKRIQESLQLVEKRNRAIIQNAPDGIVLLDEQGRFTFISPSTVAMFGYEEDEVLGQSSLKFVHPDDLPLIGKMRVAIQEDPAKLYTLQYRYLHKDGSYRWIESTYKNLFDEPGLNSLVVNFRDITDARRATELLQKSQASLETAQQIAHLGSWELNPASGAGLFWSKEMFSLFRRDPAMGVPPLNEFMELVKPGDRPKLLAAQGLAIELREPITVDYWVSLPNEADRCYQATISPVFSPLGDLQMVNGTVLDITQQRRSEESLRESERRLRQAQQIGRVGSWEFDVLNDRGTWSDEMYRIFDQDQTFQELSYDKFISLIHPADRALVDVEFTTSIETRKPHQVIHRVLDRNGNVKFIQERWETQFSADGSPLRSIGTALDITERRLMELEIQERVKELTCLFEVSRHLNEENVSVELQCQRIVESLSPAMQFPELAVPMVELDSQVYTNNPLPKDLSHFLSAEIIVNQKPAGRIAVYYLTEVPFLPEEQHLLNNLASMFGMWLERRETDAELRAATERFNQIADNIQEVFWMLDLQDQRITYISPAYEIVWGRSCQSLYQNAQDYIDAILPEDRHIMFEGLERQMRGERIGMEYRIQRPTGEIRWIWDRSFPIFDEHGVVVRTAGVATDMTAEKLANLELEALNHELEKRVEERTAQVKQSEMTYRALFENSNDAIFLLSPNGHEISANRRAADMLEYSLDEYLELANRERNAVVSPEQRADASERFAAAIRGEAVPLYERTLVTRSGRRLDVEINLSTVRDVNGEIIMLQSVVRDITERKRAQEMIRRSSEIFSQFMRRSPIYAYVKEVSPDNSLVLQASDNFSEMIGVPGTNMIGRNMFELFPPEFASKIIADDWDVVAKGDMIQVEELMNGRIYTTIKFPILLGDQTLLAGYTIDITDRKQAEEILRESRDELRLANAALEKASRLKDEFLASMSHELRTPLTGILGLSEALQMQTYGALSEKQLKSIKTIETSGRHLLELINDILDLSKIEAGKLDLVLEPCSIQSVCQSSLQLVKGMSQQKKINVQFTMDPPSMVIQADMRRLKQMLVNLLSNAIKFTPAGGQVGLAVDGMSQEGSIRMSVWDTGIGIQSSEMDRLFKPFTQLDSSLARQYSGTGLGLSLVHRMADLHGGRVEVESVPGQGSRFTLVLPAAVGDVHASTPVRDSATPALPAVSAEDGKKPLVLIADDNQYTLEMLADFLNINYKVATAANGLDLIRMAEQLQPDFILTDIQMPGLDGMEVIRRIRSHPQPGMSSIPIIAITALAMSGDREKCLEAGANEYMSKPVMLRQLAETIEHILQERTTSRTHPGGNP